MRERSVRWAMPILRFGILSILPLIALEWVEAICLDNFSPPVFGTIAIFFAGSLMCLVIGMIAAFERRSLAAWAIQAMGWLWLAELVLYFFPMGEMIDQSAEWLHIQIGRPYYLYQAARSPGQDTFPLKAGENFVAYVVVDKTAALRQGRIPEDWRERYCGTPPDSCADVRIRPAGGRLYVLTVIE